MAGSSSSQRRWGLGPGPKGWGLEGSSCSFLPQELHTVPTTPSSTSAFQNRREMQKVPPNLFFPISKPWFHFFIKTCSSGCF